MLLDLLIVRTFIVQFFVLREGDALFLIDTGFLGGRAALTQALRARGWDHLPICGILLTHGHLATMVTYDIAKMNDSEPPETEAMNAYAIEQRRLMQQARPGEPMMEVWWQSAGAVMILNITPNPAREATELSFMLEEPRMVALDLYRNDGQRVKRVTEGVSLAAGQHQLHAELNGVSPGLYLLGVTTDRGEQALRRIYVTP